MNVLTGPVLRAGQRLEVQQEPQVKGGVGKCGLDVKSSRLNVGLGVVPTQTIECRTDIQVIVPVEQRPYLTERVWRGIGTGPPVFPGFQGHLYGQVRYFKRTETFFPAVQ